MRFAKRSNGRRAAVGLIALMLTGLLASCGGGGGSANTVETHCVVRGSSTVVGCPTGAAVNGPVGPVVSVDVPVGPNTTEVVVDSGPPSFSGATLANVAFVTVTLCSPGSASQCVTIDHVMLDTGSMGLRIIKSKVSGLSLPVVTAPGGTATAVECYPFVLGGVWGPLARADLQIGGEIAANLPIQLIDDSANPDFAPTANCLEATNNALLSSVGAVGANGIIGVGVIRYDCGQECSIGPYGKYNVYYACDPASKACVATTMPNSQQVQNPVSSFSATTVDAETGQMSTSKDDNGTIIVLPAIPETGASVVRGRLVFGIGTKRNNQPALNSQQYNLDVNSGSLDSYLTITTGLNGTVYPFSYIDSGSNALFFDAPAATPGVAPPCSGAGLIGPDWACPKQTQSLIANFTGHSAVLAQTGTVNFSIANANSLFSTANFAFSDLAGTSGQSTAGTFVWGLPFFFGRSVFTSIWQQTLSENGPWWAF